MNILAKHAYGKKLIGDGLQISAEAKRQKQLNPLLIDATIGTLFDENSKFYKLPTIDRVLRNLPDNEFYTYSSSDGGKDFKDGVLKWIFQNQKEKILSNRHCEVIATPGGTGAVSAAVYNSLDPHQTILLPDLYWGPYANMATSNELEVVNYRLLFDNHFNFEDFKTQADEIIKKQGKIVTILNDPCNNPTGYSLTNQELETIIDYMNDNPQAYFSLIYDIAYLDFDFSGMENTRKKFAILTKAKANVIVNIAVSFSKSFSIYGLRLGALIMMGQELETVKTAYDSSCFLARTRWSNSSKPGISLLIKVTNDLEVYQAVLRDIEEAKLVLSLRADMFISQARIHNLDLYPYYGGFFITIRYQDGKSLFEELKRRNIYVLPFKGAVRISISALTLNEINGLAKEIRNAINSL
jgi:aromatic-amino-acid transaminase